MEKPRNTGTWLVKGHSCASTASRWRPQGETARSQLSASADSTAHERLAPQSSVRYANWHSSVMLVQSFANSASLVAVHFWSMVCRILDCNTIRGSLQRLWKACFFQTWTAHVASRLDDRGEAHDCGGRLRHYREAKRSNRSRPSRPVAGRPVIYAAYYCQVQYQRTQE